jgi:hypothetical protein
MARAKSAEFEPEMSPMASFATDSEEIRGENDAQSSENRRLRSIFRFSTGAGRSCLARSDAYSGSGLRKD